MFRTARNHVGILRVAPRTAHSQDHFYAEALSTELFSGNGAASPAQFQDHEPVHVQALAGAVVDAVVGADPSVAHPVERPNRSAAMSSLSSPSPGAAQHVLAPLMGA